MDILIRPARPDDAAAIWAIIGPTIRAGETYTGTRCAMHALISTRVLGIAVL